MAFFHYKTTVAAAGSLPSFPTRETASFEIAAPKILTGLASSCARRRVVILFHSQLTEAFSKIDASTPAAKRR